MPPSASPGKITLPPNVAASAPQTPEGAQKDDQPSEAIAAASLQGTLVPLRRPTAAERQSILRIPQQTLTTQRSGESPTPEMLRGEAEEFERFLSDNPDSPYRQAVKTELGHRYLEDGRFSRSLVHFGETWAELKDNSAEIAQVMALRAGIQYGRLLASLGRTPELIELCKELDARRLPGYGEGIETLKEWSRTMQSAPGISFRCGTLALDSVHRARTGRGFVQHREFPSPTNGFTVAQLLDIARAHNVQMLAIGRVDSQTIPVPSVVHWKQEHYAAVVTNDNGKLLVVDPTFHMHKWMTISDLMEEASGVFLIPADMNPPAGYRTLSEADKGRFRGKGWAGGVNPGLDGGTCQSPDGCCGPGGIGGSGGGGGGGGTGGGGSGSPGGENRLAVQPGSSGQGTGSSSGSSSGSKANLRRGCSGCLAGGMPQWSVSDPGINLFVVDTPLSYTPTRGPSIDLTLFFQKDSQGIDGWFSAAGQTPYYENAFGLGWRSVYHSSLRFTELEGSTTPVSGTAFVSIGSGGTIEYYFTYSDTSDPNPDSGIRLQVYRNGDGTVNHLKLHKQSGGHLRFATRFSSHSSGVWFLTEDVDENGIGLTFTYDRVYDPYNTSTVRLKSIIDADSRSTLFNYAVPSNNRIISSVQTPAGKQATFTYTASSTKPQIYSITDAAGIFSSFLYNASDWISSMTTPYGTTTFAYDGTTVVDRWILVTEPGNAKQLFALMYGGTKRSVLPTTFPSDVIPLGTPLNALYTTYREDCGSFHWDRLQMTLTSGTNPETFVQSDFLKSRWKRWLLNLHYANAYYVSPYIASDQLPASGTDAGGNLIEGQVTFFDWEGDGGSWVGYEWLNRGKYPVPSVIARRMPDGTTWYEYTQHNDNVRPTIVTETYTKSDGTIGTRSHQYTYYAGNTDVQFAYGPDDTGAATRKLFEYTYNGSHQPTSIKRYFGPGVGDFYQSFYAYDATTKKITSMTTEAGQTSTFTYQFTNSASQITGYTLTVTDSPVGRTRYEYWGNGVMVGSTDYRGLTLNYEYDGLNRLKKTTYPAHDGLPITTEEISYTRPDNVTILGVTKRKDRHGQWEYFTYDSLQRLTHHQDRKGYLTFYQYCACGSPSTVTRGYGTPRALAMNYAYDWQGRLTQITYPGSGGVQTYAYDKPGRMTLSGDGTGYIRHTYDQEGKTLITEAMSSPTVSIGKLSVNTYNVLNQPVTVLDRNGVQRTQTFDWMGRLLTRTSPNAGQGTGTETFVHNNRGLIESWTALSKKTAYTYDAARRKLTETPPNLPVETMNFTYNGADDLLTLTDGRTKVTTWTYDIEGKNRTKKYHGQASPSITYTYYANGWLNTRTTAAKGTTSYTYDFNGNLTGVNYPVTTDLAYTFDELNRMATMTDALGTTTFTYNNWGAPEGESVNAMGNSAVTTYYNNRRLPSSRQVQNPAGGVAWTADWFYDAAGRVDYVTGPSGTVDYSYKAVTASPHTMASTLVEQVSHPNGTYIANVYDARARWTSTEYRNAGTVYNKHLYGYDNGDRRTSQTHTVAGTPYANNYTYDDDSQLKTSSGANNITWNYDQGFNPTSRIEGGTTTFAQNDWNQTTGDGLSTFSYDGNGNRMTRTVGTQTVNYYYDDENQLIRAETDTGATPAGSRWKVEFVYDGKMRMRKQLNYTWSGATWGTATEVRFLYDGMLIVQERTGANAVIASYLRGLDLSGSYSDALSRPPPEPAPWAMPTKCGSQASTWKGIPASYTMDIAFMTREHRSG